MSTLSHLQSLQDTQREGYMPETSPPPPPSEPDALATLQKEYADLIDRFNHTTLRQADTIQAQAIQIGQQRGEIRRLQEALTKVLGSLQSIRCDDIFDEVNLEFIVPRPTVHVVVAYRYGLRDDHSYVVGAYATETLARQAADEHVQHRGGKYGCEVLACDIRHTTDEYDPDPPQVAYFESPYFGILGRGSQCADHSDRQKRHDSARWCLEETRLPLLLVRILSKVFNLLRWINPTKP